MKIFGYNKHFYCAPEDDAAGSGSATSDAAIKTPPAPPEVKDKTYTQKEKDADEAKLRRRYDREIKEQKQKIDQLTSSIEELKSKVDRSTHDPVDPVAAGQQEIEQRRYQREMEELRAQIAETKTAAETERQKRLELEKSQLLDNALLSAGVNEKHMLMARRYFAPQIVWDDLDQKWMFTTKNNNLVEIADGVQEELPDNLKPSALQRGGAGTNSGLPVHKQRKAKELEEAEKKLQDLKEAARRNGRDQTAFAAFTRQKRVVQLLQQELNAK